MDIMKWLSSLFGRKLDRSSSKAIQGSVIPSEKENFTPYSQKRRYPRFLVKGMDLPLYRAGIQFKEVTPGTLIQLKDFMRIAGVPEEKPFVETDKPSALRYVVTREEGAILNYPTSYTVKKISLVGIVSPILPACMVAKAPIAKSLSRIR
jgi:hypothetical protein